MSKSRDSMDEGYLKWLYSLVAPTRNLNPARTHWILVAQLHQTIFDDRIPNDDNRAEDGKDLRHEFLKNYSVDDNWLKQPCSMLEMLVSLARRISFNASYGDVDEWFWKLLENLNLAQYTDDAYDDYVSGEVDYVLSVVNDRTYDYNGEGGLFPINNPREDQRRIEIWYQMSQYLQESEDML